MSDLDPWKIWAVTGVLVVSILGVTSARLRPLEAGASPESTPPILTAARADVADDSLDPSGGVYSQFTAVATYRPSSSGFYAARSYSPVGNHGVLTSGTKYGYAAGDDFEAEPPTVDISRQVVVDTDRDGSGEYTSVSFDGIDPEQILALPPYEIGTEAINPADIRFVTTDDYVLSLDEIPPPGNPYYNLADIALDDTIAINRTSGEALASLAIDAAVSDRLDSTAELSTVQTRYLGMQQAINGMIVPQDVNLAFSGELDATDQRTHSIDAIILSKRAMDAEEQAAQAEQVEAARAQAQAAAEAAAQQAENTYRRQISYLLIRSE